MIDIRIFCWYIGLTVWTCLSVVVPQEKSDDRTSEESGLPKQITDVSCRFHERIILRPAIIGFYGHSPRSGRSRWAFVFLRRPAALATHVTSRPGGTVLLLKAERVKHKSVFGGSRRPYTGNVSRWTRVQDRVQYTTTYDTVLGAREFCVRTEWPRNDWQPDSVHVHA